MDSYMDVDDSSYRREVLQQNTPNSSPRALLGKRSRADFEHESTPSTAVSANARPYRSPSPNQRSRLNRRPSRLNSFTLTPVFRRFGGFIVSTVRSSYSLAAAIWSFFKPEGTEQVEIIAVQTNESGRKRRAVAAISEPIMVTPPDSRPSSRQEEEEQSWAFNPDMTLPTMLTETDLGTPTVRERTTDKQDQSPQIEPAPPSAWPREDEVVHKAPESVCGKTTDRRPPGVRQTGVWLHSDAFPIAHDRIDVPRPTFQRPHTSLWRPVRLPLAAWPVHKRLSKSVEKDKKVDMLVQRAERLKLGTEEEQSIISTYRRRREAELAAKEQQARWEEEQQIAQEKARELEELRKKEEERILQIQQEKARKRKASLIQELNPVWKEKLDHAMQVKAAGKVLAQGPEGNDLTRKDFGTLLAAPGSSKADAWLNDEIVNAWFASIVQQKLEQAGYVKGTAAPFATYNSAWYNKMRTEGADSLKRWSRRKGIQNEKLLQAEKIYMPINTGAHWLLLIISPKERKLEVLDSMRGSPSKYFQYARNLLQMELGKKYIPSEWTESDTTSCLQDNTDDCGAFTCWNGLASAKNRSYEEVTAHRMQDARRSMGAILLNGGFTGDFAF